MSRGLREDGGSVGQQGQPDSQAQLEQREFEVKEDWMVFKGPRVLQ